MAPLPAVVKTDEQLLMLLQPEVVAGMKQHIPALEHEPAALCEFVKFMLLSAEVKSASSGPDPFIPVTSFIDKIWHFYILQRREYAAFCNRLRPGAFIHHRSILYADHSRETAAPGKLHQEDLSWLASYVVNFGPFRSEAIPYWCIPDLLCGRYNWTVERLRDFCQELISVSSTDH